MGMLHNRKTQQNEGLGNQKRNLVVFGWERTPLIAVEKTIKTL